MAPSLAASWRSFWHELTSNDRHAGPDAPYRSGQHHALAQSRNTPLTHSSASGAYDSRTDLDPDLESGNGGFVSHNTGGTTSPPYRSSLQRGHSSMDKLDGVGTGEIQMQSFNDGLPPPPPVGHSWRRINRWMEDNYEELFENIQPGATINDINELEHELDCTLPQDVRESLQLHDGQERGGRPTGVIFGCMLLDCEEIIQEWQNWRTVNEAYFNDNSGARGYEIPQAPLKAFAGSSSSASAIPVAQPSSSSSAGSSANPHWRADLLAKQDSQPPNAIQKAYAHPAWIPLARDWGGNNIAVDLAPGPAGKWGQVILMGRDYDCKYVISRSWANFLATLADDLSTDKWFIEEETQELKLRQFKNVEPAYIDILRWRCDQKYGRKPPKRKVLRVNSNVSQSSAGQAGGDRFSPYGSPIEDQRGRSPQRFSGNGNGKAPAGTSSPRAHVGSPLARVTEENSSSLAAGVTSGKSDAADALGATPSKPSNNADRYLISPILSTDDIPSIAAATTPSNVSESTRASLPLPRSRLGGTVLTPSNVNRSGQDDNDDDEAHDERQPLSPSKELPEKEFFGDVDVDSYEVVGKGGHDDSAGKSDSTSKAEQDASAGVDGLGILSEVRI